MKTLSNFEKIAQKSKRRSWLKIILISTIVTLFVLVVTVKVLNRLTAKNAEEIRDYYDRVHTIAFPNVQYNAALFEPTSQFSGYYHMERIKDIDGIEVAYEDIDAPYAIVPQRSYMLLQTRAAAYPNENAAYTYGSGYKSPIFYNRDLDYDDQSQAHAEKTQDISFLSEMPDYAVEMAVTFDKGYTLKEIAEKIPDNLKINWYWIGTTSQTYDTASLSPQEQIGFSLNPYLVRDGKPVEEKEQQSIWEESYRSFTETLQVALDKDWLGHSVETSDGEVFNLHQDMKTFLKENPTIEKAKFAGIILTGRSENFAPLQKADWIYASNIGQSVQIQPYHRLDK